VCDDVDVLQSLVDLFRFTQFRCKPSVDLSCPLHFGYASQMPVGPVGMSAWSICTVWTPTLCLYLHNPRGTDWGPSETSENEALTLTIERVGTFETVFHILISGLSCGLSCSRKRNFLMLLRISIFLVCDDLFVYIYICLLLFVRGSSAVHVIRSKFLRSANLKSNCFEVHFQ